MVIYKMPLTSIALSLESWTTKVTLHQSINKVTSLKIRLVNYLTQTNTAQRLSIHIDSPNNCAKGYLVTSTQAHHDYTVLIPLIAAAQAQVSYFNDNQGSDFSFTPPISTLSQLNINIYEDEQPAPLTASNKCLVEIYFYTEE